MSKIIKLEQQNCQPCIMVSQFLDEKGVQYERVDVSLDPDTASQYRVMGVPVTILLDNEGNEIKRSVGFNPVELEEIVESASMGTL